VVVLFAVVLRTDAGTAVFPSDVDLFFVEATLSARRKFDLRLERVLTFPSGVLGDLDL